MNQTECGVRSADPISTCENKRDGLPLSYRRRPVSRQARLDWIPAFQSVRESKLWQGGRPRPPRQYYANSYNLRMALKPGGGI